MLFSIEQFVLDLANGELIIFIKPTPFSETIKTKTNDVFFL